MILAVRNVKKAEPLRDEIIRETNNNQVKIMQVDLSDLESVHTVFALSSMKVKQICIF